MPSVLGAGFGPYAKTPVNPASLFAQALDGETICGRKILGRMGSEPVA